MPGMQLTTEVESGIAVVKASGYIDAQNIGELDEALADIHENQGVNRIIFEGSKVEYISSSGISTLILHIEQTKENGGELCLANPSTQLKFIIETVELGSFFREFGSVQEAKKALEE